MTEHQIQNSKPMSWPPSPVDEASSADGGLRGPAQSCAFIVDDETGVCRFIATTLGKWQVQTENFVTAGECLAALDRRTPDIIFLDIALESSDAVEVIRGLGARQYGGVVQLMSGRDTGMIEDVRRIGSRHGLDMRPPLQKPFRAEAIRRAITGTFARVIEHESGDGDPAIEQSLDEALAEGWLELWYQPKIDIRNMTLAGAEGLIRCRHPRHGVLCPASFLPQASEAALRGLTEHVVLTALDDWDDFAAIGMALHIAVNSSLAALEAPGLPELIRENRPVNERWPGLILELAEADVIRDIAIAHEIATQLRIYGVTLSIDDFGEGYSSFARLRELVFAELKLDRSFVKNCAKDSVNAGICRAIIDLAHQFGVPAVAEGLDNAADLQAVHRMGCDMGQGYLLAKPLPKAQFASLIRRRGKRKTAS